MLAWLGGGAHIVRNESDHDVTLLVKACGKGESVGQAYANCSVSAAGAGDCRLEQSCELKGVSTIRAFILSAQDDK